MLVTTYLETAHHLTGWMIACVMLVGPSSAVLVVSGIIRRWFKECFCEKLNGGSNEILMMVYNVNSRDFPKFTSQWTWVYIVKACLTGFFSPDLLLEPLDQKFDGLEIYFQMQEPVHSTAKKLTWPFFPYSQSSTVWGELRRGLNWALSKESLLFRPAWLPSYNLNFKSMYPLSKQIFFTLQHTVS